MTHGRRAATVLLALTLGLGAAACGGDKTVADPTTSGSATPTPTPSASPTPTPTPTPSAKPLSKFEDEAPVMVARQWAAGIAKDINSKNKAYPSAGAVSTKKARGYMGDFGDADLDAGLFYPGPVPFTPTRVRVAGDTARVSACAQVLGWAQTPGTHLPAAKRSIRTEEIVLKKVGGTWKFDDFVRGTADCSSVPVKGVPG